MTKLECIMLRKAIKALEKQIQQKPVEDGYCNVPRVCPMCGEDVSKTKPNYCPCCGQKLDWSK